MLTGQKCFAVKISQQLIRGIGSWLMNLKVPRAGYLAFAFLCIDIFFTRCKGQKVFGGHYLKLEKTIPLGNVKGRLDHMDVDLRDQLVYLSALGDNALLVIDLKQGKLISRISGLDEPQGVAYIPQHHEILVANGGNGNCYFYDAATLKRTATIHLPSDADDVHYDSANKKIYVGYGEGGIACINADTRKVTAKINLPVHPEGFQLDKLTNNIYVNLPDRQEIAVLSSGDGKLTAQWKMLAVRSNFPLAIDEGDNLIYVACRRPARLLVIDGKNGQVLSGYDCVGDADDLYYDDVNKLIYVSGGEGFINVFKKQDTYHLVRVANISTGSGSRTSLFIPSLQVFCLAERAEGFQKARLIIYSTR